MITIRRTGAALRTAAGVAALVSALSLASSVASAQDDFDALFGDSGASDADAQPQAAQDRRTDPQPEAEELIETIPVGEDPPARKPPSATRRIEEIVVTAQKREQSIQDVPISMTALSSDFLIEQGVTDIGEALQLVPNAAVDAAGFFAAPRVRGFTFNNNNKSFEPPVGMVLDGVPHTRVPYFLAALFDVQRMEVLRGPQGTSFGKNTTAGLIHVISNGPSPDPNGYLSVESGDLQRRHVEAGYGGPLNDFANFRVAGLYDSRDGYVKNTFVQTDPQADARLKARERSGIRASIEFPDLGNSNLLLSYEAFELFDGGAALETLSSGPVWKETILKYDPNADFTPGNWVHSQDLPDFRDISITRLRAQWDKDLGPWSIVALAAHGRMEQTLSLDTDFEPAEAINGFGGDFSPMSYAEVRLVAPQFEGLFGIGGIGSSDVLFGINASRREILDSDFIFGINNGPFYDLVSAAGTDAGSDNSSGDGSLIGGVPVDAAPGDDSYDEFNQRFEQSANELSVFFHSKWQISQAWGVELGGRMTTERKSGIWDTHFTTPAPNPSLEAIGTEEFMATRKRKEFNVQPKVSLNWQPADALSVFLHWEQGFKGGGFNAFAFREGTDPVRDQGFEDDDLTFEEEVATNVGLDFKTSLLDGAARLNVSLFRQVARDFQVLIRENPPNTIGTGTSRVVNAEEALAQGIEADLLWLANSWLTVVGSVGLLDTEYLKFLDNECPAGSSNADPEDDGNPRCDATGKSFPFAPELSATVALRAALPISNGGLSFTAGTLVEYESDQLLDVDLDERKRQDAFTRLKADIGIRHVNGWSLRLIGENLTNTVTHVRLGDIFEDIIVGSQRPPRLFYVQFRQDF